MDTLPALMDGFAAALSPHNLLFALIGCILGTILGLLPGIGSTAGMAILIPLTMAMDPAGAIIMLAAIFYGGAYGGTITSVLLNIPGEGESAITAIDGCEMTKRGRAGVALTTAGIGSFIGGTTATIGLVVAAEPLARLGLRVGPPEFFSLVLIGLALLVGLVGRSVLKGMISAAIGLLIAMVGIDPVAGLPRFTFGQAHFFDGISYIPVLVGIFGLGELLASAGGASARPKAPSLRELIPSRADFRRSAPTIARGTAIGGIIGLIPGVSSAISSLLAYSAERKISKHGKEFGKGAIEGVAAPETANNAHSNASFVPLFTLGIPASPAIAVLMGAFLQNGLTPGPRLFVEAPDLVWTVIASLFVGNLLLLVLNVPLVGVWTRILAIPYSVLRAIIFAFIVIGSYAVNNSVIDIYVMVFFGVVGFVFRQVNVPVAPLVLTLILGPFIESALRESLQISQGDFGIFLDRPLSLVFLIIAAAILLASILGAGLKRRAELPVDAEV
ncbi:transporter [Brachybacterium sp. P6-10-X1]|uniref:tripartite tricarboxylate transporter permease n=1 Tax=Brachybacterium sp. P6-10-X1 TaxID=1903186 RepID=UPI000971B729|nr:tripartite tricarboxylate transporter permease [Brachybacterium sp. P6-10-X1]APX33989.1 transporter [Brachybacterium sp. P6-10-X1]